MSRPITRKSREQQSDDDAERSLLLYEQNVVASTSRSSPGPSRASCISTTLHFDESVKLFIENKINKKNVWTFKVVDIAYSMLREKHPTMDNLVMASMVISASTRIYSLRVDSLYSDGLNMAGGLPKDARAKKRKIVRDTEAGPSKRRKTSKAGAVSGPEELNATVNAMDIDDDGESREIVDATLPINETLGLMSRENTITDRVELELSLQAFDINAVDLEPVVEGSNNEEPFAGLEREPQSEEQGEQQGEQQSDQLTACMSRQRVAPVLLSDMRPTTPRSGAHAIEGASAGPAHRMFEIVEDRSQTEQRKARKKPTLKKKKQDYTYDPNYQPPRQSKIGLGEKRPRTKKSGLDETMLRGSDNQEPNINSETSFCSNNVLDGEEAGTSQNPSGAADIEESGELTEPSPKVGKNPIPYTLRPKQIDMTELKECTWKLLEENTREGEDVPLSSIYSKLPGVLSKNMGESLSFPLAFLSVLHLAGEKGLTLKQKEKLDDVGILLPKK